MNVRGYDTIKRPVSLQNCGVNRYFLRATFYRSFFTRVFGELIEVFYILILSVENSNYS